MAGKTNTHSDSVLNVLRGTTLTGLANIYVALFTVAPSDTGGGTESTYGTDTRKVLSGTGDWTAPAAGTPTGRQIDNATAATWSNWDGTSPETFVAAGLFDALTLGTLLYWATITNRTINAGETATFAVGAIVVTED